ncbi:MAG: hypothetical protein WCJ30_17400 [Deltaproteobacteria bacterium]
MDDTTRAAIDRLELALRRWRAGEADVARVVDEAAAIAHERPLDDAIVRAVVNDLVHAHETVLTAEDVPVILKCLEHRRSEDEGDGGYTDRVKSIDRASRLSRLHRNPYYPQPPVRCATWGPRDLPPVAVYDHEGGPEAAIEYFRSATGRDPDLRGRACDRQVLEDRVVRIRVDGLGRPSLVEAYPLAADQVTRVQFWRYRWTGTTLDRTTLSELLSDWESERITLDQIEQEALHFRSIIDPPAAAWSPWACVVWDVIERLAVASLSPLRPIDGAAMRAFLEAPSDGYESALLGLTKYFTRVDWEARRAALHPTDAAFLARLRR